MKKDIRTLFMMPGYSSVTIGQHQVPCMSAFILTEDFIRDFTHMQDFTAAITGITIHSIMITGAGTTIRGTTARGITRIPITDITGIRSITDSGVGMVIILADR
jgi:hypothetical protein